MMVVVLPTGSLRTRMGCVVWNVGQAVVVDDLEDLGLLQTGHCLRHLVVVDQHDALAPRTQQVIARERADDLFVLVEHGVAAVAALEHDHARRRCNHRGGS